jgi:uncharacterized alpha-E superfamily protein
MLSRVADAIFWMARYMERSICLLRVARTHYIASQDDMLPLNWQSILRAYGGRLEEGSPLPESPQDVLRFLVLERQNEASVINNIMRARENARTVQDHITKEMWQAINDFHHLIREPTMSDHLTGGDPVTVLDLFIRQSMLYHGMADTTMARGEGSYFLNCGRFLERALQCVSLLEQKVTGAFEAGDDTGTTEWRTFLYSMSGYELYLKTYREGIRTGSALQMAVLNAQFPHSLLYCLQQIHRNCERLQPETEARSFQEMDFLIGNAVHLIRYSKVHQAERQQVEVFLGRARTELCAIAGGFDEYYFGLR